MRTTPRTLARFGEVAVIFGCIAIVLLVTMDIAASLMGMRIP